MFLSFWDVFKVLLVHFLIAFSKHFVVFLEFLDVVLGPWGPPVNGSTCFLLLNRIFGCQLKPGLLMVMVKLR